MQNDKEFKQLFKSKQQEISDEGFSENVINRLPEKVRIWPQMVVVCFAIVGIMLMIAIQGEDFFKELNTASMSIEQMNEGLYSYFLLCFVGMLLSGSVGYAIYKSDNR